MRTLTDQTIDALRDGGLAVGDGNDTDWPDGGGSPLVPPFVVVYPLVQTRDGTLDVAFSDVDKWIQISCVATGRQQAEGTADQVEALLAASDLVLVELVRSGTVRDDTTGSSPLFTCAVRARLRAHA